MSDLWGVKLFVFWFQHGWRSLRAAPWVYSPTETLSWSRGLCCSNVWPLPSTAARWTSTRNTCRTSRVSRSRHPDLHWRDSFIPCCMGSLRLPLCVLERLVESLRLPQVPILHAQVFLFFRVLLLRMSPQHLTSLWPTMITELVREAAAQSFCPIVV